jgi:hypothetical protein
MGADAPDMGADAPDMGADAPDMGADAPDMGADAPDMVLSRFLLQTVARGLLALAFLPRLPRPGFRAVAYCLQSLLKKNLCRTHAQTAFTVREENVSVVCHEDAHSSLGARHAQLCERSRACTKTTTARKRPHTRQELLPNCARKQAS